MQKIENTYFAFKRYLLLRSIKRYLTAGKVLEVGCGNGEFLKLCLKFGIDIWGTEPSPEARKRINTDFKERIIASKLDELENLQEQFSTVLLIHVLEHINQPWHTLERLNKLLKNEGIIIIQIPNIESMQARIFGRNWAWLFVPQHVAHFSISTIKKLLEETSFQIISVKKTLSVFNAGGWAASILPWNPINFPHYHDNIFLWLRKFLYFILTLIFVPVAIIDNFFTGGGIITIIARKKTINKF